MWHRRRSLRWQTYRLVESYKAVVICACLHPDCVWLATGGKGQLNDRVEVLAGRKVIAFLDVDGYDTWRAKTAERPHLGIIVSDLLEKNATPEDRAAHIDIADRLIAQIQDGSLVPPADCPTPSPSSSHYGTPLKNPDYIQIAPYISPEYQGVVALLMDDLGLVPVDIQPLSHN